MYLLKKALAQDPGLDIEDIFEMNSGDDFHEQEIIGLRKYEQEKLRDKLKWHCCYAKIILSKENESIVNNTKQDVFYTGRIYSK